MPNGRNDGRPERLGRGLRTKGRTTVSMRDAIRGLRASGWTDGDLKAVGLKTDAKPGRLPKRVAEQRAAQNRAYLDEARQSGNPRDVQNATEALQRAGYGTDGYPLGE